MARIFDVRFDTVALPVAADFAHPGYRTGQLPAPDTSSFQLARYMRDLHAPNHSLIMSDRMRFTQFSPGLSDPTSQLTMAAHMHDLKLALMQLPELNRVINNDVHHPTLLVL